MGCKSNQNTDEEKIAKSNQSAAGEITVKNVAK